MLEIKKYWKMYIGCSLLGAILFLAIYGVQILNPLSDTWLLGEGNDLTQHYIGWIAYRQAEWMLPIGCTDNLAYPFYTSVIFTDSIPLFAVLFKLFSPFLPGKFQYFGIFGLLCYMLQAFFASLILKRYLLRKIDIILGSIFFVLSPVMLECMYYHTSLAAHFLLLLAMLGIVYYEKTFSKTENALKLCGLTAFLASSIHIYLLAMCALIWMAYCIIDIWKTKKVWRSIFVMGTFLCVSFCVIWILGGLNGVFTAVRGGLGKYGLNLNAFINSQGISSILPGIKLPDINVTEGYAYLGFGMILILLADIFLIIGNRRKVWCIIKGNREKVLVLILLMTAVYLFAIFPAVYWNDHLLFELNLPYFVEKICSVFRATGRFSWLIYYMCFITAIIIPFLLCRHQPRMLSILFAGMLLVQAYDILPKIIQKKESIAEWNQYSVSLCDSVWDEIVSKGKIKHVYFGFYEMEYDIIFPVTEWAVSNGMTVNRFYFARSLDKEAVADLLGQAMWEKNEDSIFIFRPEDKDSCEKNGFSYIVTEENLLLAGKGITSDK